jgi:hypothetical protein
LSLAAQNQEQKSKEKIKGYELKIKELNNERKKLKDSLQELENNINILESTKSENDGVELRNKNKKALLDKINQDSVQILSVKKNIQDHELKNISQNLIKEKKERVDKLKNWIARKNTDKKAVDDSLNMIVINAEALKKQYKDSTNNSNKSFDTETICKALADSFSSRSNRLYALATPDSLLIVSLQSQIASTINSKFCNSFIQNKLVKIQENVNYLSACLELVETSNDLLNAPYDKLKTNQVSSGLENYVNGNKINNQLKNLISQKINLLKSYCGLNQKVYKIYELKKQKINKDFVLNEIKDLNPLIKKEEYPYLFGMLEKYKSSNEANAVPLSDCK